MPTRPSALFAVNGATVGAKVALTAGQAVQAILDDISGVSPVTWSISRTDETTTAGTYSLVQSGSVGQQCDFNASTAGTAFVLKAQVAGGIDPVTGQEGSALMVAEVKCYVPTTDGLEVVCAGEQAASDNVSNTTFGVIEPLNEAMRAGSRLATIQQTVAYTDIAVASGSAEEAITTALPAGGRILGVDIELTTPFTGGTMSAVTVDLGDAGDADALVDGADVFTAAVDGQASSVPLGIAPHKRFAAETTLNLQFAGTGDTLDNLTAGSFDITILYALTV